MREIKFRAWNKRKNVMFENTELALIENCDCNTMIGLQLLGIGVDTLDARVMDCVLMQYTGLKDKNGKEIYEGDILSNGTHGSCRHFKMCWSRNHCGWRLSNIEKDQQFDVMFPVMLEVIGNIYESPELLKD